MSVNIAFSRELLKRILDDVRAYRTSTGDWFAFKLTDAWVYKLGSWLDFDELLKKSPGAPDRSEPASSAHDRCRFDLQEGAFLLSRAE